MCKKRAKTCKNVQKRASQVLIYQKNVQKREKTCISNIFGPNLKTCIFKVRAAWDHAAQGPTVISYHLGYQERHVLKWINLYSLELSAFSGWFDQLWKWVAWGRQLGVIYEGRRMKNKHF